MAVRYTVITVHTTEEARCGKEPLHVAVVDRVHRLHINARCVVYRGVAGCYENGEIVSQRLEVLSHSMPLRIEIVVPSASAHAVLPTLDEVVQDGVVLITEMNLHLHHVKSGALPRHLKARDVMTPSPTTVTPDTTIGAVARTLLTSDFGSVPIVDPAGRPVGIVTHGDLVERAGLPLRIGLLRDAGVATTDELLGDTAPKAVRTIMSAPVMLVDEDSSLSDAAATMASTGYKRLPVVDRGGRLTGILSRIDLLRAITREATQWQDDDLAAICLEGTAYVRDAIDSDTPVLGPEATVGEAIAAMGATRTQRVAVVNDAGILLGMASDRDLLAPMMGATESTRIPMLSRLFGRKQTPQANHEAPTDLSARVCEVMCTDLITVRDDDTLIEAAQRMAAHRLKRLPVVDGRGRYLGMLSRAAVLRASAPSDDPSA